MTDKTETLERDELEDETAHLVNEWVGTVDDELETERGHFHDPTAEPEPDELETETVAPELGQEQFYTSLFRPMWELPASLDPAFARLRISEEKEPYARPASDVVYDALEYLFPDFGDRSEFIGKISLVAMFGAIQVQSYREAISEIQARQLEDGGDDQGGDPHVDQGGESSLAWMDGEKRP